MSLDFKFSANDIIKQKRTSTEDIEKVKKWLLNNSEKYVPSQIQDELVVLFLLSCDNEIELTKKTIVSYYRCRKQLPGMFDQRKMEREDLQRALRTMRMVALPVRTDDNCAIVYFSLRDVTLSNFELLPIMKATFLLMDIQQEVNPPDGIIYVVDMEGFGIMHGTKLRPDPLKKYFEYLGNGLPMKFKAMHFLNANYFLEKLLGLCSMLIDPDVMRRVHVHQANLSLEELYKLIPKKCLPKEFGGDLEPREVLSEQTLEAIKNKEIFWDVEESMRKCVYIPK